jgi:hypothetical protein
VSRACECLGGLILQADGGTHGEQAGGNRASDALGGVRDDGTTLMKFYGRHPSMCSCVQRDGWPASCYATGLLDGMDVRSSVRDLHHQEHKPEARSPHVHGSAHVVTGGVLDAA